MPIWQRERPPARWGLTLFDLDQTVVVEFPDYAAALACYRSPEYQENIKVRLPHSTVELIVIEGYDGPQP